MVDRLARLRRLPLWRRTGDRFRASRVVAPTSLLFITLDSCRYDTFVAAKAPNLKSIGPVHRAKAPGSFTYASHAAMFRAAALGARSGFEAAPRRAQIAVIAGPGGVGRRRR